MAMTLTLITCDCCGQEGLAELRSHVQGLTLQIRARRHGQWHAVTLDMEALATIDINQYCLPQQRRNLSRADA